MDGLSEMHGKRSNPTVVGLLHLRLHVPQAASLKDKRRCVKSFKDRAAHAFNVSVAEVDSLDNHRMAVLAIATVSNDKAMVDSVLQKILAMASMHRDMLLVEHQIEFL